MNPKKPTALKILTGQAKKNPQRINKFEPMPTEGVGEPPAYLSGTEKEIWREILGHVCPGVIMKPDRIALELLCRLVNESRVNFADMSPPKLTQMKSLLSLFGMSPVDRTKIIVPKADKTNPFDGL